MRRKRLYIPIIAILASILTLLCLLGISTVRNLHRDRVRMEESLFRNGIIVLRGLEASFRFSMRGMTERRDSMQRLISQVSDLTEIHFIALVDENGIVLAHSDDALVGTTVSCAREACEPHCAGRTPEVVCRRWILCRRQTFSTISSLHETGERGPDASSEGAQTCRTTFGSP